MNPSRPYATSTRALFLFVTDSFKDLSAPSERCRIKGPPRSQKGTVLKSADKAGKLQTSPLASKAQATITLGTSNATAAPSASSMEVVPCHSKVPQVWNTLAPSPLSHHGVHFQVISPFKTSPQKACVAIVCAAPSASIQIALISLSLLEERHDSVHYC